MSELAKNAAAAARDFWGCCSWIFIPIVAALALLAAFAAGRLS